MKSIFCLTFIILFGIGINAKSCIYSLTSSGLYDVFVAKYDTAGNVLWAEKAGGVSNDEGFGICLDKYGNSYVTGEYRMTATFGSNSFTSAGFQDIFAAKYDISGNNLWAITGGGADPDFGYAVTAGSSNSCYLSGEFTNTATFSGTLTSYGGADILIGKISGPVITYLPSNLSLPDITIFPNPSAGSFILKTSGSLEKGVIEIYNSIGKFIYKVEITGDETEVNLPGISEGLYFIKIHNENHVYLEKVIFNRP